MNTSFEASRSTQAFCGRDLLDLKRAAAEKPGKPEIVRARLTEAAGAAPVELLVRMPDGSEFNLLGRRDLSELAEHYAHRRRTDAYAANFFFQPGLAAPLWPLANRLTGREVEMDVIESEILGVKVRAPLNHGRRPDQRRHHLHGFAYRAPVAESVLHATQEFARAESRLAFGFLEPYWTGRAELRMSQTLSARGFEFEFTVTNTGDTAIPSGGGAHPYFLAPSGDPSAVRLWIPGRRLVEIDNYANVLPTGRTHPIAKRSEMDFHERGGVPLRGRYLDNLWIDLEPDENGFAFAEFLDEKADFRARMTATTANVIGIQAYAPEPAAEPALGVFAALELVTNLPDPREDLWGSTPTGMRLLQPGETFRYGYRLELSRAR